MLDVAYGRGGAGLLVWACAAALCGCADDVSSTEPDAAIELDASGQLNPDGSNVADDAGQDAEAIADSAVDGSAHAPPRDAMADDAAMDAGAADAAGQDAAADASTDDRDAHVDNGGAAPRAFADCTEPWGWESSPSCGAAATGAGHARNGRAAGIRAVRCRVRACDRTLRRCVDEPPGAPHLCP